MEAFKEEKEQYNETTHPLSPKITQLSGYTIYYCSIFLFWMEYFKAN